MQKGKMTRRKFVAGTTGATLGAMIVPRHVLGGPGYTAPSDKLNVAVVGCGGQGASDATELVAGGENIVALADVDFGYVDKAVERRTRGRDGNPNPASIKLKEAYDKAKRHTDFRKMLETQKDIDAVLIATPDHLHAVIAKASMELGKHVYCEKPLTWSVHEARVLRETAARSKVVTQMGNQGHSSHDARLINEWVQAGVIGPVKEVHVWTNRPIWPQGVPRPAKVPVNLDGGGFGNDWTARQLNKAVANAILGDPVVPSTLNWDLYLGPAPEVPYHPIYHPFNWRGWLDWGTGAVGDMAAHLIDHPYWALGLTQPTSIEATSTPWGTDNKNNPVSYPLATQIVYHFPARGAQPPVKLTWYDGGLMPARPDVLPDNVALERGGGVMIVGEKGILMHETYGAKPRLFPESLMEAAAKVPQKFERIETDERKNALHRINWAKACKGQGKASSPFEYATQLTETMLLGVVAMRAGQGKRIYYDAQAGKITNVAEANQFLHREYRQGWSL
ncbi:MAG: Gfo/Idh/MocA family oxidoreductase [Acidobacteria bacterium]|nr:Gfo/Idh/MocA family oxidoreductase [Acidobacteriota bacterium]